MAEEIRIRDALPERSLTLSEAEALVDAGGENAVLPAAVLTGESGDEDVVSLVVETPETVYALGFDPEREGWVGFETWAGGDEFDRGQTADRIEAWVLDQYEDAVVEEIWNPSA